MGWGEVQGIEEGRHAVDPFQKGLACIEPIKGGKNRRGTLHSWRGEKGSEGHEGGGGQITSSIGENHFSIHGGVLQGQKGA